MVDAKVIIFWLAIFTAFRIGNVNGSYLDRPRLHFSGSFQADVSTLNNYHHNFKVGVPHLIKEWNPLGTGEFRLYNLTVSSVTYLNGTSVNTTLDPVVGLPMLNSDIFTPGKLVDLDTDVQLEKCEIWGQKIGLNWKKPRNRQHNAFIGDLTPTNLGHDVWKRAICIPPPYNTTHNFSSVAKSILTNVTWADDDEIDSKFLQELKQASQDQGDLSIRLITYFMVRDPSPANYTFGRIHGTIGPAYHDEPVQFCGQRKLHFEEVVQPDPIFFNSTVPQCKGKNVTAWIYNVPFRLIQVREKREVIKISADFGNAVTMDQYQDPLDLGILILGIKTNNCVEYIGDLRYRDPNWLQDYAGIQEFPEGPLTSLTAYQLKILKNNPVVILRVIDYLDEEFSPGPSYMEMQATEKNTSILNYCNSTSSLIPASGKGVLMLQEKHIYVRPWKEFIFRANPGEKHPLYLFVTEYGVPMQNVPVNLFPTPPSDNWPIVRYPIDGVTYESSMKTNGSGIATFYLHAHNVGQPRNEFEIDGQVYKYSYNVSHSTDLAHIISQVPPDQTELTYINDVAILVFSNVSYPEKDSITWEEHVSPIFKQYAQLYPVMKPVINLANYTDVKGKSDSLMYVLKLPIHHPTHMPVTRDLSKAKREMILQWLENGCRYNSTHKDGPPPEPPQCKPFVDQEMLELTKDRVPLPESCKKGIKLNQIPHDELSSHVARLGYVKTKYKVEQFDDAIDSKCDCLNMDWQRMALMKDYTLTNLQCLLQTAIRLEFSTLPPYLTALYSIIDGCNMEVQRLIQGICMQEMLHMAQASNLLIALGGHPLINSNHFAPKYPGPLPGHVLPGLHVHLRKASIHQIRYNFMAIEFPSETAIDVDPPQFHDNTIGTFYKFINKTLNYLYEQQGEAIFCQDCFKNEVSWPYAPGKLHNVTGIESAHAAIQEIVEQGEGVGPFDPSSGLGDQLAHYYKFEEIVCGNYLKENSSGGYEFNGDPIALDESGVYPMKDDPRTGNLDPHTNASHYSRVFNEGYRHLLNRLHEVFNGKPDGFREAVSLMQSLKLHAKLLMRTFLKDGRHTAGPAWEYDVV